MKLNKKTLVIGLLAISVLLTACSFVGTTKEDMEKPTDHPSTERSQMTADSRVT